MFLANGVSLATTLVEVVAKQVEYDPPQSSQPSDKSACGPCREVDPQMPRGSLFDRALWPGLKFLGRTLHSQCCVLFCLFIFDFKNNNIIIIHGWIIYSTMM